MTHSSQEDRATARVVRTENFVKFGRVVFEILRADRQTRSSHSQSFAWCEVKVNPPKTSLKCKNFGDLTIMDFILLL